MRLGFDARSLTVNRRRVKTGAEYYDQGLLCALAALHPGMLVYQGPGSSPVISGLNVEPRFARLVESSLAWGLIGLGWQTFRSKIDVLVVPEQYVPVVRNARTIVTVHDVAFRKYPNLYSRRLRAKLSLSTWAVARFSDRIVASSNDTRNDLITMYHVSPQRVFVVYPGCDSTLFHPRPAEESAPILRRLRIPRPYLIYVGTVHPRKNLGLIIQAASRVRGYFFVIAGLDTGYGAALMEQALRLGVADRVRLLGYVSDEVKAHLMAQAAALILPSHHEGFGLPALEAMASGTPVIVSNRGALPEVAGSSGLLIDPEDLGTLVNAIDRLDDPAERSRYSLAAIQQARRFSWTEAGRKILDIARSMAPA